MSSVLRIHLFGIGRVEHPGGCGPKTLPPAVRSLLGYLLLNNRKTHNRGVLATAFWPDIDHARAHNRLSSTVWRLRKVLEPPDVPEGTYLTATRSGGVAFNGESEHWLDVADVEQATDDLLRVPLEEVADSAIRRFEELTLTSRPLLLQGVDQSWILLERERLDHRCFRASVRAMNWHAWRGDIEQAIGWGELILAQDPLREEVHRALIGFYGLLGRRADAQRQFDWCRTILLDELDVTPLPETIAAAALALQASPDLPGSAIRGSPGAQARRLQAVWHRVHEVAKKMHLAACEIDEIARTLQEMDAQHAGCTDKSWVPSPSDHLAGERAVRTP